MDLCIIICVVTDTHTHTHTHTLTHTHTHTNQRYVGKRCDLRGLWENLIFFGSVFQRVGAKKKKERSPYDLVLTDAMHSTRLSEEDRSCLEPSRGRVDFEQVRQVEC